jgi:hypothetical protein
MTREEKPSAAYQALGKEKAKEDVRQEKRRRSAEALRENLKKRKSQNRGRAESKS